ncbi:MAG: tRNA dihydrouridine synthase DusB [Alphaproteobacteria bacterium]|nr:tRNA dihydrouridine synthase DusB [Alphaproteobacteria bacterium]MBN2675005.1 tRNA dihydrouridine synthase DusB [Alphaproteobacteria bacterium]
MFTDNQIFAAPLAGITDKPFRKILRKFSPDISMVTEMISCHSLTGQHKNCLRNFDDYSDEGEIGAQIFGAKPELMAQAAKILESQGAKWIDINMGCPVPKVATKAGAGAWLMRDHALAGRIISTVVAAVKIPVSIKTRLGWDDSHKDWEKLIHIAGDAGAKFAVLHGRTRAQGYSGQSALEQKPSGLIPVIGNGDIKSVEDVSKIESLGYDGVMIGRALLGKPWLLRQLTGKNTESIDIKSLVLEHLDLVLDYYGISAGVPLFRKHAAWYSAGIKNSSEFRIKVNQITEITELKTVISEFFNCFGDI